VIVGIQLFQLSEVAELGWDGATELIPGEVPVRTTTKDMKLHSSGEIRNIVLGSKWKKMGIRQ